VEREMVPFFDGVGGELGLDIINNVINNLI